MIRRLAGSVLEQFEQGFGEIEQWLDDTVVLCVSRLVELAVELGQLGVVKAVDVIAA